MKKDNSICSIHRRWFSVLTIRLGKKLNDYYMQRQVRVHQKQLLKLGDHLLRDIGCENFGYDKRHS